MALLRLCVALSVIALVTLYTEAAPATDFLGPPRTLEDDTDVNPSELVIPLSDVSPKRSNHEEEVTADERFYRVYENGTIEFKTALSNGHIQYQRISNKVVDGRTIQVYEGYISQRYADGRYGTSYYIADENGYRRTRVEVDTKPPVLPQSGPQKRDKIIPKSLREDAVRSEVTSEQPALPALEDDSSIDTIASKDTKRQTVNESELPKSDEDLGSSATVPPTYDEDRQNEISSELPELTVKNVVKTIEGLGWVQSTTEEVDAESSTGVPTLPTTEAEDDEHLGVTPVLSTTDENNVISSEGSTETPASPANEEVPTLSATEETKTIQEDSNENSASTEVPTIETSKAHDDIEVSTELSLDKTTEGIVVKAVEEDATITESSTPQITEDSTFHSSEDRILEPSTEAPIVSTTEKVEISTDLTADIDDEDLEAITEGQGSVKIEGDVSTDVKDEVASTESSVLPTSEESIHEAAEEEDILGSATVLPTLATSEEDLTKTAEEEATQSDLSTKQPALPVENVEDKRTEQLTEEPAVANAEEDFYLSGSKIEQPAPQTSENIEDKTTEASAEIPALPVNEENVSKSVEDNAVQTELPALDSSQASDEKHLEVSTEISESPVTEGISPYASKDDVAVEDEHKNLETSTEIAESPVTEEILTKTVSDDVAEIELSTELPALSESQPKEGRDLESSSDNEKTSSIPALPATENTVNITKIFKNVDTELLATDTATPNKVSNEGSDESTTQNITEEMTKTEIITEQPALSNAEEGSAAGALKEQDHEIAAKVEELPTTEESITKTAEGDDETTASVIIV